MTNIHFVRTPTRNATCQRCARLINLDRVPMNCKHNWECPYFGKAADRLAEALAEWGRRHPVPEDE